MTLVSLNPWVERSSPFYECNLAPSMLRCPNLAVKEAEDDENIEEEDIIVEIKKSSKKVPIAKKKKQASVKLSWVGEVVEVNLPEWLIVSP